MNFPITITLHANGTYSLVERPSTNPPPTLPPPPPPARPPATGNEKHRRNFLQLKAEDLRLARRYLQVSGTWDKTDQAWLAAQFRSFGAYAEFLDRYSTPDPPISGPEHLRLIAMAQG